MGEWLRAGITAGLWCVAAGGALYWAMKLAQPREQVPMRAQTVEGVVPRAGALAGQPMPNAAAVQRALGHVALTEAPSQGQQRFELLGVVASASGAGSALMALDGALPRAFVQGQIVTDAWTVWAVQERSVILRQDGGGQLQVSLPPVD